MVELWVYHLDQEDSMTRRRKIMVEIDTRRATAFASNAMAMLGLVVIGYPLAPLSIRAVALDWIMLAVGITELIFGRHLRTMGRALTLRPQPVRSTECARNR